MRTFNKIRKFLQDYRNEGEGRKFMGKDKFGNKVYQIYSYDGLPIKRETDLYDRYRVDKYKDMSFHFWQIKQQDRFPDYKQRIIDQIQTEKRQILAIEIDKQEEKKRLEYLKKQNVFSIEKEKIQIADLNSENKQLL